MVYKTGTLTDFQIQSMAGRRALLYLVPSSAGMSTTHIFAGEAIEITPNSFGDFGVEIKSTIDLFPDIHFTGFVKWVDALLNPVGFSEIPGVFKISPEPGLLNADFYPAAVNANMLWTGATAPPGAVRTGTLWLDPTNGDLKRWDGSMWDTVFNTKGPRGDRGMTGPRGLDGVLAVNNDAATKQLIEQPTETSAAGDVRWLTRADAVDDYAVKQMVNRNLVLVGDSITNLGGMVAGSPAISAGGYWGWALSMFRSGFTPINKGIGGDTAANVVARMPDILAADPGVAMLLIGTNDVSSATNTPLATYQGHVLNILGQLLAVGCPVVVLTIPARGAYTGGELNRVTEYNTWLLSLDLPGVYVVDAHAATANGATGVAVDGYLTDNLHPTPLGAAAIGKAVAPVLERLQRVPIRLMNSNNDANQLLFDGRFASGGDAANPPTGWTSISSATGVTFTRIPRVDDVAGSWWQIARASDAVSYQMGSTLVPVGASQRVNVGDYVEAAIEYQLEGLATAPTSKGAPGLRISFRDASDVEIGFNSHFTAVGANNGGTFDRAGVFHVPRTIIPAGTDSIRVIFYAITAGTYRVDRASLWKA